MSDILHFVQYYKQSKASEDLGNVLWKRKCRHPLSCIDRHLRDRHRLTEIDRQTHRIKLSHRHKDRQTHTQTQTETDRHKDRIKIRDKQTQRQTETDTKTDRIKIRDRHTQTQRHTDRDRNINIWFPLPFQKVVKPPVEHSQQGINKPTQTGLYERQRHKLKSCSSKQTTKGGPMFVVVFLVFLLGEGRRITVQNH